MWGHNWLEKSTVSRYKTEKKKKDFKKSLSNKVPLKDYPCGKV